MAWLWTGVDTALQQTQTKPVSIKRAAQICHWNRMADSWGFGKLTFSGRACRWKAQKGMGTGEDMKISQKQTNLLCLVLLALPHPRFIFVLNLVFCLFCFPVRFWRCSWFYPTFFHCLSILASVIKKKTCTQRKLLTSFYAKKKYPQSNTFQVHPHQRVATHSQPFPMPWLALARRNLFAVSFNQIPASISSQLLTRHGTTCLGRRAEGCAGLEAARPQPSLHFSPAFWRNWSYGLNRHLDKILKHGRRKSPPSTPQAHCPIGMGHWDAEPHFCHHISHLHTSPWRDPKATPQLHPCSKMKRKKKSHKIYNNLNSILIPLRKRGRRGLWHVFSHYHNSLCIVL